MSRSHGNAKYAGYSIITGSSLWAVAIMVQYAFDLYHPGEGLLFVINQTTFFLAISGWLGGTLGLFWIHVNGGTRFARITLGMFVLGWLLVLIALPIIAVTGNEDMALAPIGGLLTVLFGLLAGIAVARSRLWSDWRRFSLLIYTLLHFLVLLLPVAISGHAPHVIPEFMWAFFWLPLAYSLITYQNAPVPASVSV
jgi:hypothetical protein